jgi:hypothetical protein
LKKALNKNKLRFILIGLLVLLSAIQTRTDSSTSKKQEVAYSYSKHDLVSFDISLQDELLEDGDYCGEEELPEFLFLSFENKISEQVSPLQLSTQEYPPSAESIILMSCFRI